MPYAYLGPEGTFSEAALRAVDPGAEPLSCPTIQAALAAVRDGTAERAVVPIESSVEGVVTATLDDLATGNGMVIRAELQISHRVRAAGQAGDRVRRHQAGRRSPAVHAAVPRLARRQPAG